MVKELLTDVIGESVYLMKRDLEHVSDDQANEMPNGTCRPIYSIVAECAGFTKGVASAVRDGKFPEMTPEQREAMQSAVVSKAEAIAMLDAATQELIDAVNSADEATLGTTVVAPWGQELTRAKFAYWAAAHVMYHDGQVCYFQNLNGDREMHWM